MQVQEKTTGCAGRTGPYRGACDRHRNSQDSRVHTTGGVITAGQPLLDIVPKADLLIVRAQIKPDDIDLVRTVYRRACGCSPSSNGECRVVDGTISYVSPTGSSTSGRSRASSTRQGKLDERPSCGGSTESRCCRECRSRFWSRQGARQRRNMRSRHFSTASIARLRRNNLPRENGDGRPQQRQGDAQPGALP